MRKAGVICRLMEGRLPDRRPRLPQSYSCNDAAGWTPLPRKQGSCAATLLFLGSAQLLLGRSVYKHSVKRMDHPGNPAGCLGPRDRPKEFLELLVVP